MGRLIFAITIAFGLTGCFSFMPVYDSNGCTRIGEHLSCAGASSARYAAEYRHMEKTAPESWKKAASDNEIVVEVNCDQSGKKCVIRGR